MKIDVTAKRGQVPYKIVFFALFVHFAVYFFSCLCPEDWISFS